MNNMEWKSIGILKNIPASSYHIEEDTIKIDCDASKGIRLEFEGAIAFSLLKEQGEAYVLSTLEASKVIKCCELAWVLPKEIASEDQAMKISASGIFLIKSVGDKLFVEIASNQCEIQITANRPASDFYGNKFIFNIQQGSVFTKTFAAFYWDTLLPSIIERTRAIDYPISEGYVVSTLQKDHYAGTYPDVDHEFQIKGRMAMGNSFDFNVVRRMMALQFQLMSEDPEMLWRNPCAIQPNGNREYHVRRNSMDFKTNAEMFLITGNVEIVESAWLYVAATKGFGWLRENISNLEGAMSLVESLIDQNGRLWSDVYYEDQVMKDGREGMSAALAANSFHLLAELEALISHHQQANHYRGLSKLLLQTMIKPMPMGFWDEKNKRFTDWVDRNGVVHDHIHLLANVLPVLLGYANKEQEAAIDGLIQEQFDAFQRFPSFMSSKIEDYTVSEIGDGGPYDLCAAGRYWCWDAAYWDYKKNGAVLEQQLLKVATQAEKDNYRMGERYDMNYVYYIDEKNWHGAAHYYEYPCVFIWVMISNYLGIKFCLDADLHIAPKLTEYGDIELGSEQYAVAYRYNEEGFTIKNLSRKKRSFKIDLSTLYPNCEKWILKNSEETYTLGVNDVVDIRPHSEIIIGTL